jgi:hypothetical protein
VTRTPPPLSEPRAPPQFPTCPRYLISAGWLLGGLQALAHMDNTHFGSSLGGKPVTLHKIRDHRMLFRLGAKGLYLERTVDRRSLAALHRSFCNHSSALRDPARILVTSASQPGKHNFLCFTQVLSAAGGAWEAPQPGLAQGFPTSQPVPKSQLQDEG